MSTILTQEQREFLAFLELYRRKTAFVSSGNYQLDTTLTVLPSMKLRIKHAKYVPYATICRER
jgi:hypothetical protein